MTLLTLDGPAVVAAVAMGGLFLVFGGQLGLFFVLAMLYFLFLSAAVTQTGHSYKKRAGLYEKKRGIKNVLANGSWPLFMIFVYFLSRNTYPHVGQIALLGFFSGLAAVTSDKFSSEIGVLDGFPRSIIGFKKVDKGVSGGITWLGLVAGFIGSFLIAVLVVFVHQYISVNMYYLIGVIAIGGFAGTLFDSFLGWFEERGIGNKFSSNFFGSVFGSLVSVLVLLV
jgi:uncharacterized protein (TIGR00297 family)